LWIFNTREGSVRTLMVEQEKERRVMFCPITEAWGGWTRGAVIGPQTPVVDIVSREGEVGDSREWSRSFGVGGALLLAAFPPGPGDIRGFVGVAFGGEEGESGEVEKEEEEDGPGVVEDIKQGRTG